MKGRDERYIDIINDMYDVVSPLVRTTGGETREFSITIGLHRGSTLSPYIFP